MSKFYSASTGGFYVSKVHGKAIPADAVEVSDAQYAALFEAQSQGHEIKADADGRPVARPRPAPTPSQAAVMLSQALQDEIDATARAMGYDNALAAISYADEPSVPKYQAEAVALRVWRSQVWAAAESLIADVAAGGEMPTVADFVTALPKFRPTTP